MDEGDDEEEQKAEKGQRYSMRTRNQGMKQEHGDAQQTRRRRRKRKRK